MEKHKDYIASKYKSLRDASFRIAHDKEYALDLLHESLLYVMQSDKLDKLVEQDTFEWYVITTMHKSVILPKSNFYKKYIAYKINKRELITNLIEVDNTWIGSRLTNEQLDLLINRLPKFERMVFLEYIFSDFSYETLSKETGIPKDYLYQTIKSAKRRIKNAICKT